MKEKTLRIWMLLLPAAAFWLYTDKREQAKQAGVSGDAADFSKKQFGEVI